jgi:hypothetical protein
LIWLTGLRAGEFVTLPISAVNLDDLEIKVSPGLGVRVNGRKGRIVHILNDPELLRVVKNWDRKVKDVLPKNGLWFAHLKQITGEINPEITINQVGENRYRNLYRDMKTGSKKSVYFFALPTNFDMVTLFMK